MAYDSQLYIVSPTGDGDITCAINAALWNANSGALEAYAAQYGIKLWYYDTPGAPGAIEANINTVADAQYQIQRASQLTTAGAKGPSSPASTEGTSAGSVIVTVVGGLALATLLAWTLLRR